MLPFRSIQLMSSTCRSEFSIQSTRITTNFTCRKPFSPLFLRYLSSQAQSPSKHYTGVTSLDQIAKGVVHLQCESSAEGGVCHVYLVGTCHVSQKSCEEVKAVINYLKPQVVFLELCWTRSRRLTDQTYKEPTTSEMFNMWKSKKANFFWILYSWSVAMIGSELGIRPGAEFRVAYEEARSYGARVILGDRPIQITMRRMQDGLTMWRIIKILCHELFFSKWNDNKISKMIEEFKDEDLNVLITKVLTMKMKEMEDRDAMNEMMQILTRHFPSFMEVLVVERDKYMSHMLLNVARKHSSVVAVVGRGHLSGIEKYWMQPFEVQSLLEVPSEKKNFSMFNLFSVIKAAASAVVTSGKNLWSKK